MQQIPSAQIAVVIQGPLFRNKGECDVLRTIASVQAALPEAEIIVSTWDGEPVELLRGVPGLRVCTSADPGALTKSGGENVNRQLVSTLAGLQLVTRPYALKLRGDQEFVGDAAALCAIYPRNPGCLLGAPLTVTNLYIRNPERHALLFHVSDLAMFGRREDMLDYWEGPAFSDEEMHFSKEPLMSFGRSKWNRNARKVPEQAYCIRWLAKHGIDVTLRHTATLSRKYLQLWGDVLRLNFHVLDAQHCGLRFPARFSAELRQGSSLISAERALMLGERPFSYPAVWISRFITDPGMFSLRSWLSLDPWYWVGQKLAAEHPRFKVVWESRKLLTRPVRSLVRVLKGAR